MRRLPFLCTGTTLWPPASSLDKLKTQFLRTSSVFSNNYKINLQRLASWRLHDGRHKIRRNRLRRAYFRWEINVVESVHLAWSGVRHVYFELSWDFFVAHTIDELIHASDERATLQVSTAILVDESQRYADSRAGSVAQIIDAQRLQGNCITKNKGLQSE